MFAQKNNGEAAQYSTALWTTLKLVTKVAIHRKCESLDHYIVSYVIEHFESIYWKLFCNI